MNPETVIKSLGEAIPHLVMTALLFVPFLLCALAVWRWRGGSRFAAVILLLVTGYALATDLCGSFQDGHSVGMLLFVSGPSLLLLLVLGVAKGFANLSDRSQSRAISYTMAALSSAVLFAGVLFLWFFLSFFFSIQFGQSGMVLYRIVGGTVALAVSVYSFRATVKRQAMKETIGSSVEVAESDA